MKCQAFCSRKNERNIQLLLSAKIVNSKKRDFKRDSVFFFFFFFFRGGGGGVIFSFKNT